MAVQLVVSPAWSKKPEDRFSHDKPHLVPQIQRQSVTMKVTMLILQDIRHVVRDIEQSAREILTLLQTVHQCDGIKSGEKRIIQKKEKVDT